MRCGSDALESEDLAHLPWSHAGSHGHTHQKRRGGDANSRQIPHVIRSRDARNVRRTLDGIACQPRVLPIDRAPGRPASRDPAPVLSRGANMSVGYLRAAAEAGETDKLIRFVRLHVGDGNEGVGKRELDKSWIEAIKILLREEPADRDLIESVMAGDESTLALLYFHLHFYLVRRSGEWIHDGSQ
jgi:hypothetical protein